MTEKSEHWFDQPLYRTGLGIGFWVILFVIPDLARGTAPDAWHAKLIGPIAAQHLYFAVAALVLLLACWATGLPRKRLAGLFLFMLATCVALLAGAWIWPSYGALAALAVLLVLAVLVPKFWPSEWWG